MVDAFAAAWAFVYTPDFAGLVCGVAGTLLLAAKGRAAGWGFVAFLASNVGWIVFASEHHITKLLAQHLIFAASSVVGVWVWLMQPRLLNSRNGDHRMLDKHIGREPTGDQYAGVVGHSIDSEPINDRHAGILGHANTDPELLRQCAASGQMDACQMVAHGMACATPAAAAPQQRFDFRAHLARQREFSERTFGPGQRTAGVVDHICKELIEVLDHPTDLSEWIDVVILALDGAWRAGYGPDEIIAALEAKQTKNEARRWPDWRTAPRDRAIEHVRTAQP